MEKIKAFFVRLGQGGTIWQFTLCVLLVLLVTIYIGLHYKKHEERGREFVTLNKEQLAMVNTYLDMYAVTDADTLQQPLADSPSASAKTIVPSLATTQRNALVKTYLDHEYSNSIDSAYYAMIDKVLLQLNNKDGYAYLSKVKLKVKSPFWLTGGDIYIEAFFWSLFGVLVSLIYYVALANSKGSNEAGNEDTGSFNPDEVPGQIAKMFYAPACTIVLVLGYHYLSGANESMVDISVNKGLILFSFMAGFFSGRVMRFIDKLKELILPYGSAKATPPTAPAAASGEVSVTLGLEEALGKTETGADIAEAGFNAAEVTLIPEGKTNVIALSNPEDDQADCFVGTGIVAGKYMLKAIMAHKKDDDTIINLEAEKQVEIVPGKNELSISLALAEAVG